MFADGEQDLALRRKRLQEGKEVGKRTAGPLRLRSGQALHCATPDFLSRLVALASFLRLSLRKAAHAAISGAAWQEIRVRSGRDDNGMTKEGWRFTLAWVRSMDRAQRNDFRPEQGPGERV
jgi:hypothetical protein